VVELDCALLCLAGGDLSIPASGTLTGSVAFVHTASYEQKIISKISLSQNVTEGKRDIQNIFVYQISSVSLSNTLLGREKLASCVPLTQGLAECLPAFLFCSQS
jgi:hypothetical protein